LRYGGDDLIAHPGGGNGALEVLTKALRGISVGFHPILQRLLSTQAMDQLFVVLLQGCFVYVEAFSGSRLIQ